MNLRKIGYFSLIAVFLFLSSGTGNAQKPVAGEEALFTTSTAPDALIVLDLSGSMSSNPAGGSYKYGSSESCTADTTNCVTGSSAVTCGGGFCASFKSGCNIDCSRLAIAKRAIFNILDDNKDGVVNSSDEGSLGVRIGYMRFYNCGTASQEQVKTYSYTSGCNTLIRPIDSKYSLTYCANNSSCTINSGATASTCVSGENASGGTPIAAPLHEANLYLEAHKTVDSAKICRQKFAILITDGEDTFACGNPNGYATYGQENDPDQYKRRRESVAKAKALADAGYKVFVVGLGSTMSASMQNTLNWMAYFGGTDNPNATNSGSVAAYDPSAVTSCGESTTTPSCNDADGPTGAATCATSNDPATAKLRGYAYLATNWDELALAMKTTIGIIREAIYSFTQASIQSSRTQDENFLYEGSFDPKSDDPFWIGHLKKYKIKDDGTVDSVPLWDAGETLQSRDPATRIIKTYTGGSLVDFTTANMTPGILGVSTTAERDAVVGYFRGDPNPDNWRLGDVFRSTPITVGTPSAFFDDLRDANNAFATHRTNHVRSSANGYRLIVSGANDGQFHVFKTQDNGSEAWSFIPPNLLSKLKNIYHTAHPTSLTHQYFVDGPVTVADVWLGDGDGTSKNATDWKTILVFGEGRGSTDRLWSSSSSCDVGLTGIYNAGNPYYCAYYALDITDSLNPSYLWHISPSASQGPYLGDSWSKMMTGRVRITVGGVEKEKWVGFIGGGYNGGDCSGGGACDTRGKGFFVIDLMDGSVLWSYTLADNVAMKYSMPAQPAIVDTDNDSFVDTVYLGDNGGNMWRFKLCRAADMPSGCGAANWSGGLFFDSSTGNIRPIYTSAAVAKDTSGNLWVYWGTGDKTDPTASNAQEQFYGVKDNDRTSTYSLNNIQNITTTSGTYDPEKGGVGYRILMNGMGEKILADPTVFGGVVYFTTFTPPSGGGPCDQGGEASLYAIKYTTGGGILSAGLLRNMSIGTGIPSAPVLSLAPGSGGTPDLYVTVSGGSGTSGSTFRVDMTPPGVSNRNNMLYWHDLRVR